MSPTAIGQTDDPAEPLKHSEAATILKGAEMARITLHAGFTTVRDVGVYRGLTDVALRDAIAAGAGRRAADVRRRRLHHHSRRWRGGDRGQAGNRHRPRVPHRRGAQRPSEARAARQGHHRRRRRLHQADRHRRRAGGRQRARRARADAGDDARRPATRPRRSANIASPMPMAPKGSRRRSAPARGPSSMPR